MANPKNYKALLIRVDARDAIDRVKKLYEEKLGVDVNVHAVCFELCVSQYEVLLTPSVRQ
jgi:hypothetical protein